LSLVSSPQIQTAVFTFIAKATTFLAKNHVIDARCRVRICEVVETLLFNRPTAASTRKRAGNVWGRKASGLGFGCAFIYVMDDLVGHEMTADDGLAFGALHRLRGLEAGDGGDLGRVDGAVDALAERFGVTVVGDQGTHNRYGSTLEFIGLPVSSARSPRAFCIFGSFSADIRQRSGCTP